MDMQHPAGTDPLIPPSARLELLAGRAVVLSKYDILCHDDQSLMIALAPTIPGKPENAVLLYDGGMHALLVKNRLFAVICDYLHPEIRKMLPAKQRIRVAEGAGRTPKKPEYEVAFRWHEGIDGLCARRIGACTDSAEDARNESESGHAGTLPAPDDADRFAMPTPIWELPLTAPETDESDPFTKPTSTAEMPHASPVTPAEPPFGTLLDDPHHADAAALLDKAELLVGASAFRAYLDGLSVLRPLLRPFRARKDTPFEHLLFAIDAGCGCTTCLSLLSDMLALDGPPGGETGKYGEEWQTSERTFRLEPAGVSDLDLETKQFLDALPDDAPGVVGIHIGAWMDRLHAAPFERLLEACAALRHRCVFVFIIPWVDPELIARVEARLGDHLNVRTIPFPPHTDGELAAVARKTVASYGIGWHDTADAGFARLLRAERRDLRFFGIRTAQKLATELILHHMAERGAQGKDAALDTLDAETMTRYLDQRETPNSGPLPRTTSTGSGFDQLDALVGLGTVKRQIREMVAAVREDRRHREAGIPSPAPCLHMAFLGPPGTGKTEVARIIGRIFREEGILPQGDLMEVSRFDLVGQYIGHTGPRTLQVCRAASGSLLFLDEAYLLAAGNGDGENGDFGREALAALTGEMTSAGDRFVVILAGYGEEMENLFRMHPGLRDRVPYHLTFPPYDRDELCRIAQLQLFGRNAPDPAITALLRTHFDALPDVFLASRDFGNARYVRNLTERIRMKALMRLSALSSEQSDSPDLLPIDFESALADRDLGRPYGEGNPVRMGF